MMRAHPLDGVLVVDKPAGPTSHDVVACVRRAVRIRKVGHLGTLDPMATGVLPLAIGRATRLVSLLTGVPKEYDALIRLGIVTSSYDVTGDVLGGAAASADGEAVPPAPAAITRALEGFVGAVEQRPPPVSAKKIGGVRAYELARTRRPVAMTPVPVVVEWLTVVSVEGWRVRCRLRCSSGYYVRSLAHDLGQRLGCGGCLERLRRERHGAFGLDQAVTLDRLVDAGAGTDPMPGLVPLDGLLPELPSVVVHAAGRRRAVHGNPLRPGDLESGSANAAADRVRVMDAAGRLVAVAEPGPGGLLRPRVVVAAA